MTDLSGRVTDLEKEILALPSQEDWAAVQVTTSNRFNVVEGNISDLIVKFDKLNAKVINLQLFGPSNAGTTGNHSHVFNDVPAGTLNGVNDTFTLSGTPVPATSLMLFKNGIIQKPGSGNDFTLSVSAVVFASDNIPPAGSNLLASYTRP